MYLRSTVQPFESHSKHTLNGKGGLNNLMRAIVQVQKLIIVATLLQPSTAVPFVLPSNFTYSIKYNIHTGIVHAVSTTTIEYQIFIYRWER